MTPHEKRDARIWGFIYIFLTALMLYVLTGLEQKYISCDDCEPIIIENTSNYNAEKCAECHRQHIRIQRNTNCEQYCK